MRHVLAEKTCIGIPTCDAEILDRLNGTDADKDLAARARTYGLKDRVAVSGEAAASVCPVAYPPSSPVYPFYSPSCTTSRKKSRQRRATGRWRPRSESVA